MKSCEIPSNEVWYTSNDETIVAPYKVDAFGVNVVSNTYECGRGKIVFDGKLSTIGVDAFYGCKNLTGIIIPEGVTLVDKCAFESCSALETIVLPETLKKFGDRVFMGCNLGSIIIPDRVTKITKELFVWCQKLENVTLPNGIKTIDAGAFSNCTSLKSILIPNSVTSIVKDAFQSSGLIEITIPENVAKLGEFAFYECKNLEKVYCMPTTPPALGKGPCYTFTSTSSNLKIYVPRNSVDAYKSGIGWGLSQYKPLYEGYDF